MFQYKKYRSRDDNFTVARQIVSKYPFLGSKGFGASHVIDEHAWTKTIVACVSTTVHLIFTTYSFGMNYTHSGLEKDPVTPPAAGSTSKMIKNYPNSEEKLKPMPLYHQLHSD